LHRTKQISLHRFFK